jgi:hypothetical protein
MTQKLELKQFVRLIEFVEYRPGHKNSKGESAPWVIISHDTKEILSSHKTKEEAEEHLRDMEIHKHS